MKDYAYTIKENPENHAMARVEDVNASYKDLSEVCGRVNRLDTQRAVELLEAFSTCERPVLYKSHNKRLGHRKELQGQKGRYPQKAARIVLNVLKSAIANATIKGMIEPYIIVHISANKKHKYPRLASKGRRARSDLETSRVEVVLREKEIVKKEKKPKKEEKKEVKAIETEIPKKGEQVESKKEEKKHIGERSEKKEKKDVKENAKKAHEKRENW